MPVLDERLRSRVFFLPILPRQTRSGRNGEIGSHHPADAVREVTTACHLGRVASCSRAGPSEAEPGPSPGKCQGAILRSEQGGRVNLKSALSGECDIESRRDREANGS